MYESYQQQVFSSVEVVVRSAIDATLLSNSLRTTLREIDPEQPLGRVATLQQLFDQSLGAQRFALALFGAFAGVALLLAAIGLYDLVSYTVNQRTQEIGVRLTRGATASDVTALIVRQALLLAAMGIGRGTAAAMGATRLMQSLLFNTSTTDVLTFVAMPIVLLSVILCASLIQARRAARVDPLVTLRGE